MRGTDTLKQAFLKKWKMGLQLACNSSKEMSIMERTKAIKLSADVAMAAVRNGSTRWSRAIIANASRKENENVLIKCITSSKCKKIIGRSKKMSRRRCYSIRRWAKKISRSSQARCIARRLVKKRRELLKSLVPGGESMDECSLIAETLDYIISLRAQVDVMQSLVNASMHLSSK